MTAGPNLVDFNSALDTASGNIGEVQDAVGSAREGAQDIRWAVGTFGRIESKADEVAKILGGFGDVLDLLGKVGPLRTVFNPLERVMKDLERAVERVEAKAKQIDESTPVVNLKNGVDDAIARIRELEGDIGEKRGEFDERREPVQKAVDTFDQLGDVLPLGSTALNVVLDVAGAVDVVVSAPKDAAEAVNNLFGSKTDPNSVAGKLEAFNDAVDGNPLRAAQQLEADLCAIIDELGFLSKPFDILNSALKPIRWALDASDFIFDTVISPVLDPILDAIGVNKIFDGVRKELSKLLPDINILNGFDTNGILPDLNTQLLPSVDLGEFLGLTDLLDQANIAIDISVFEGDSFSIGTDANDVIDGLTAGVRHILSGGAGIDKLIGSIGAADIFSGGAGDDEIDGGDDESSGDMVVFSGNISEYLIEFAEDATEFAGDIFVSHVAPTVGFIGDGVDRVRNIETYVFNGIEISASTLRNGLTVLDSTAGSSASVVPYEEGVVERGFLIGSDAGDTINNTGMNLFGDEGNDHLIGTAFADRLFGLDGNDVLDGGPNAPGFFDEYDGGNGLDEVTFAASIRTSGAFIDVGDNDRGGSFLLPPGPDFTSIERIEGSDFDDVIFGSDVQSIDGDAANGTYVERLAGGAGSDLIRGFASDDRLEGGAGADILIGDGGANQYLGGVGDDVLILDPTAVDQQIDGGAGFDVLFYGSFASVVSTFDTSVEGWTADSGVVSLGTASGIEGDGAYLQMLDTLGPGVDVISAPAAFLGDQSQMLGGRISFDLDAGALSPYSMGVALVGGASGTTRLEADIRVDPAAGWQSFAVALDATGSWRTGTSQDGFGGRASDALLADVLSNLTAIEVNADRNDLVEVTRLDNFALSAVPVVTSVLSTFETGTEGWTVGNKSAFAAFSTLVEGPQDQIGVSASSFSGAAGRFAEAFEGPVGGPTSWFIAPDKFLGDQSEMIGGQLEFSTRQTLGTGLSVFNDREVALVGNGVTLITDMVTPGGSWERRSVDLVPDQWFIEGAGAVHPTQAQFEAILSNLEGLYIRGEYRNGTDQVGLDEVRLTPAPDGLSAKALKYADLTMTDIAVPDLQGEIEVDVAAGVVTRFDQNGVQIAQDTFSGIERIYGGNQDDLFLADLAERGDTITMNGGGGADRFQVGAGQQIVYAGDGDDRVTLTTRTLEAGEIYDGGRGTDTLDLSQIADARWSLDFDRFLRGGDWTLSDEDFLALETARIAGLERVITGDFDDQVFGNFSYIDTGAGNDFMRDGGGVAGQQIFMGTGDDEVYSFDFETATIDMGLGNDLVSVYGGLDGNVITVIGGPGDSTDANGEQQPDDDVFLVGAGRVHLVGGDGQDIVSFGSGNVNAFVTDLVLDLSDVSQNSGGAANLTYEGIENASGASLNDVIRGDAGSNLLIGGGGDDTVEGEGVGALGVGTGDVLYGNGGNDALFGRAGDDVLHGGAGNNLLDGGDGNDTASYSFAEIGEVDLNGVVQSYNPALLATVTADLGVTGVGSAVRQRILHQDDFEGGVSGFVQRFGSPPAAQNFSVELPGLGTAFGPVTKASAPEVQKTFDLGPDHSGPITISLDFIEIDSWNTTPLQISTPEGFVFITFTAGVPSATSGVSSGVSWEVTPASGGEALTGNSSLDYVHKITMTFTPSDRFVTLAFGAGFGVQRGEDDFLAIDNILITGRVETDTLTEIENLTGGAFDDDLTGNGFDNVLNGDAGDDTLRGQGGDDVILDGAGADVVEAGAGDDTVVAGRGSDDGRGDSYDGGAGFDVLDYSGFESGLFVRSDGIIATDYDVERYVWQDTMGLGARQFSGADFTPRDVGQALNPATANAADDLLRDLSVLTSPLGDVTTEVTTLTEVHDTYSGFEKIIGSTFDDVFYFGGDVSIFEGGLGDDIYRVRSLSDVVIEAANGGIDEVLTDLDGYVLPEHVENLTLFSSGDKDGTGNAENNTIRGNKQANVLNGEGGNDDLRGGNGDDILNGGAGGDILDGGAGNDIMDGGGGRDTASYASSATGVRLALANNGTVVAKDLSGALLGDTLTNFENLTGTNARDVLFGNGVDNVLTGGFGRDDLYGANGDDLLIGGGGDDLLNGGGGSDTVSYEGAGGRVAVFLANPPSDVGGGEGIDTFVNIENVIGSSFDDRLVGDAADNHLIGGFGNDVLIGNAGNDVLDGGNGDDDLTGSGGDDVLNGGAGNDILNGLGGADRLNGDGGDDMILGGLGVDTINGGSGNDDIFGFFGQDTIDGGSGDDDIRADGSRDVVNGGAGNDRIVGGNGNDVLWGGSGNDVLFGGGGDGAGDGRRDVFVFKSAANGGGGADRVRDFENNIDKFDLSQSGYTTFADVFADATQDGADVLITFDFSGSLVIENTTLAQLNAGDFLF